MGKVGVCSLNHSIGVCVWDEGKDIYTFVYDSVFISEDRSYVNRGNQLWYGIDKAIITWFIFVPTG